MTLLLLLSSAPKAAEGTLALTGGGATVLSGRRVGRGTFTQSGGGAQSSAGRKYAAQTLALAGGGATALAGRHGGIGRITIPGGGNVTAAQRKTGRSAFVVSGGDLGSGVPATRKVAASIGAFTGGGSPTLTGRRVARGTFTLSSGTDGLTRASGTKRAEVSQRSVTIPQGGDIALTGRKRLATAAGQLSGGGTPTASTAGNRIAVGFPTGGGGQLAVTGYKVTTVSQRSITVPQGGSIQISGRHVSSTTLGVTGGGSITLASYRGGPGVFALSGGGRVRSFAAQHQSYSPFSDTGGGEPHLNAGRAAAHPFPAISSGGDVETTRVKGAKSDGSQFQIPTGGDPTLEGFSTHYGLLVISAAGRLGVEGGRNADGELPDLSGAGGGFSAATKYTRGTFADQGGGGISATGRYPVIIAASDGGNPTATGRKVTKRRYDTSDGGALTANGRHGGRRSLQLGGGGALTLGGDHVTLATFSAHDGGQLAFTGAKQARTVLDLGGKFTLPAGGSTSGTGRHDGTGQPLFTGGGTGSATAALGKTKTFTLSGAIHEQFSAAKRTRRAVTVIRTGGNVVLGGRKAQLGVLVLTAASQDGGQGQKQALLLLTLSGGGTGELQHFKTTTAALASSDGGGVEAVGAKDVVVVFALSGGGRLYGPWPIVLAPGLSVLAQAQTLSVLTPVTTVKVLTDTAQLALLTQDVLSVPRPG